MSNKADQRPISPYMLGPYYKFQITSLLSITSRITGVILTLGTAPLAIGWLIALAMGPDTHAVVQTCLGSWLGQLLLLGSLFSIIYHLLNGIRHLIWDTGSWFEMEQIRTTGIVVVITAVSATLAIWFMAS